MRCKGGRCVGVTILSPSGADFKEILGASGPVQACNEMALRFYESLSHGKARNFIYFIKIHCSKCNTNRAKSDKNTNWFIILTTTLSVTVNLSLFIETEQEDDFYLDIFQDGFEGRVFDCFRISSLFYTSQILRGDRIKSNFSRWRPREVVRTKLTAAWGGSNQTSEHLWWRRRGSFEASVHLNHLTRFLAREYFIFIYWRSVVMFNL